MKKNMKKLLVIVMALMPSLSIVTYAQENGGGFDPDDSPIQSTPGPNNPGPRIMMQGIDPDEIPIVPAPDPNPNPCPGPRIRSVAQAPSATTMMG